MIPSYGIDEVLPYVRYDRGRFGNRVYRSLEIGRLSESCALYVDADCFHAILVLPSVPTP